jgi:NADPH-dependent curcumin reductase CurA
VVLFTEGRLAAMAAQSQFPGKTRQWVTQQDGLDKLRLLEADVPEPGEDEVLVEVSTVSLNYRDTEGWCAYSLSFLVGRLRSC